MKKILTLCLLGIAFLIFSCTKFEVVPTIDPPEFTLDVTYDNSLLNCNAPPLPNASSGFFAQDVIEIPGEGFLICGNCSRSNAMLVKIDLDGTFSCSRSDFTYQNASLSTNTFFGLGRNASNGEILITGYTDDRPMFQTGASAYNMRWTSNCNGGAEDVIESSTTASPPFDKWDVGNEVIADPFDNNFVIAGKWGGYPALYKVSPNNIGTNGIIDSLVLRLDFFESQGINIVPPLADPNSPGSGYAPPSHDILDVIKTSDNSLVGVGWVDVLTSGDNTIRKSFLFKTEKNDVTIDWIKFYSSEDQTAITKKSLRAFQVLEIAQDYVIIGNGFDQEIPKDNPNNIAGEDLNGFILHVDKTNGAVEAFEQLNDGIEGVEDKIISICKNHNDNNRYLVTGTISDSSDPNNTKKAFIKEFLRSGSTVVSGDIDREDIGNSGEKTSGDMIIAAEDGGYLLILNINIGSNHPGIRVIKTDSKGNF